MSIAPVSKPATRGCGCGGTGSGCAGGCGCNGSGCAGNCGGTTVRRPTGGFARPRFFAGQVLLDDDLAAIETYVVGKNRLRNRFLHGDGVVCGLDVTCHPCGGGSVLVGSGYALDCCGNDIVVPCREELDIPEMIRELRTATNGGYDCGPCLPEADSTKDKEKDGADPGTEPRSYWLYVRYAEQLSDPVEPYATDALCSPAGCEASRVREGYQFFLRSHRCRTEHHDIITRVLACVDSPKDLLRLLDLGRLIRSIVAFLKALADSGQDANLGHPQVSRVMSFAGNAPDAPLPDDPASIGQLIDDVGFATAAVLRVKALNDADRKAAGLTDAQISDSSDALKTAAQKLSDPKVLVQIEATARPFAEAVLRTAVRVADQPDGQTLATDNQLVRMSVTALREQKAWLLKMAERAATTDCRLAEDVAAVRIPAVAPAPQESREGGQEDPDQNQQLTEAQERLDKLTQRFLISCVCAAVNPPCANCTDDAVLLAGIKVLECEVQSICQVVRRNVVSGPGLRYWLALNRIPALLEEVCCAEDAGAPSPDGDHEERRGGRPLGMPFLAMARPQPASERLRVVTAVAQAMAGPDTRAAAMFGNALNPAQLRTDLAELATGDPQVREVVESLAAEAVKDAQAEQVTRGATQTDRIAQFEITVRERMDQVDQRLAELRRLHDSLAERLPTTPSQPAAPAAPAAPSAGAPEAAPDAAKKTVAKKAPAKKATGSSGES